MGDLLVKLYELPDIRPSADRIASEGVILKRPLAAERRTVLRWVEETFGSAWSGEVEIALSGHPLTCFVALDRERELIGFSCYDATFRGFFGPVGVAEGHRGRGVGTALSLRALAAMAESGYAYAVIGHSGADDYYGRIAGAAPIADSEPGPYRDRIRRDSG